MICAGYILVLILHSGSPNLQKKKSTNKRKDKIYLILKWDIKFYNSLSSLCFHNKNYIHHSISANMTLITRQGTGETWSFILQGTENFFIGKHKFSLNGNHWNTNKVEFSFGIKWTEISYRFISTRAIFFQSFQL